MLVFKLKFCQAAQVAVNDGQEPDWGGYSMMLGVEKWHYVLHETIGYVAYWLAGRL